MGKLAVNGLGSFYRYRNHFFTLDLVCFHENLEVLNLCQQIIQECLAQFDLELKPSKTKIVHTLREHEGKKPGFDFLGFNVRQFPVGKYQSGKDNHGRKLGFKTLIRPSEESVKRHYDQLAQVIKSNKTAPQSALITRLNPIIRGWANYYKSVVSKDTFSKLDNMVYLRIVRWANRRHPNKFKHWVASKYWKTVGRNNWVFGNNKFTLLDHTSTAIKRHIKVRGTKSPYDGDTNYWVSRMGKHPEVKQSLAKLLKRQQGKCAMCHLTFRDGESIETDHIIPKRLGGNNKVDNLQLLHRHCHDTKTKTDLAAIKEAKTPSLKVLIQSQQREKPCKGKTFMHGFEDESPR